MKERVYGFEYRKRRKGLTKNKVYRRWSRWIFVFSSLRIDRPVAEQLVRDFKRRVEEHYPNTIEAEARVVVFDRRRKA
jgi:hypothetical protein